MGGGASPAGDFSCGGVSSAFSIEPGHIHLLTEVGNAADVFMLDIWLILINSTSRLPTLAPPQPVRQTSLLAAMFRCRKALDLLSLMDENQEGKDDVTNMSGGQSCEGNIFREHGRA